MDFPARMKWRAELNPGSRHLAGDLVGGGSSLDCIEGNTLVLKQVEVLLAEGRAVGDKDLREYLEVVGHAEAADSR